MAISGVNLAKQWANRIIGVAELNLFDIDIGRPDLNTSYDDSVGVFRGTEASTSISTNRLDVSWIPWAVAAVILGVDEANEGSSRKKNFGDTRKHCVCDMLKDVGIH